MRVLLAEDGKVNQLVATRLLEKRGHEVTLAENGRQALALVETASFDAVLMDVQMPEMNGLEATRAIREFESERGGRPIPIIAMTANAMKGDRELCIDAGMDDYVAKPIHAAELLATLEGYAARGDQTERDDGIGDATPSRLREVFDADEFRESMGSEDLIASLVEMFPEESGKLLSSAGEALRTGDPEALHRASHSLKGLLGNYSARAAYEAALALDHLARDGQLEAAGECLDSLAEEIARLEAALQSMDV